METFDVATMRQAGVAIAALSAAPALANETISYTYDALGRLQQVTHSGAVNSGVKQTITSDASDNRESLIVTGIGTASAASSTATTASADQTLTASSQ